MSNLPSIFGDQSIPSKVSDPFKKECIKGINISYFRWYDGKLDFDGRVTFENGDTKGEQTFKGTDLIDVFNKISAFCQSL